MSTAAVSTSSIYQELQTFYQQRSADLQKLGQALQSGDLAGAQQEFQAIQTLGQSGPFANGDPFRMSQREQDFQAIGQALQSGDLAGAQQAFAQLKSTFRHARQSTPVTDVSAGGTTAPVASSTSQPAADTSSASASGPEVIVNLGNFTPGEQITISLNNSSNGTEQMTIGVANQQGQNSEQITLNLNPNSNQQIILNLFNSSTNSSSSSNGLSVNA